MKTKICLGVVALTVLFGYSPANAIGLSIDFRDHAYYTHGPSYSVGKVFYVWVPGHVNRKGRWVPGHYRAR